MEYVIDEPNPFASLDELQEFLAEISKLEETPNVLRAIAETRKRIAEIENPAQ